MEPFAEHVTQPFDLREKPAKDPDPPVELDTMNFTGESAPSVTTAGRRCARNPFAPCDCNAPARCAGKPIRPPLPTLPDGHRFVVEDGQRLYRKPKDGEQFWVAGTVRTADADFVDESRYYIVEPIPAPSVPAVETPEAFAERVVWLSGNSNRAAVGSCRSGEHVGLFGKTGGGLITEEIKYAHRGIADLLTERDAKQAAAIRQAIRNLGEGDLSYAAIDKAIASVLDSK